MRPIYRNEAIKQKPIEDDLDDRPWLKSLRELRQRLNHETSLSADSSITSPSSASSNGSPLDDRLNQHSSPPPPPTQLSRVSDKIRLMHTGCPLEETHSLEEELNPELEDSLRCLKMPLYKQLV